ncbi:MAG: Mini-ribonuclease 3 [Clostridia bacterium]|nr:Mini-ribonuclease 3 [Clostridia bacterium]
MPPLALPDVNQLGLLELAYIGDTVCDLYVREGLVRQGIRVREMHRQATAHVNAQAQADALERISPLLNETEAALVRRGRNAKAHHAAPHGIDERVYSQATAFEALLGSMYLS